MGRDPEMYYFTVFGAPGDKTALGLARRGAPSLAELHDRQWDVHARGRPISTARIQLKCSPGSRKGLRVLAAEEDKAFVLLRALDAQQKQAAVLQDKVPERHDHHQRAAREPAVARRTAAARMTAVSTEAPARARSTNTRRAWSTTSQPSGYGASTRRASTRSSFAWIGADALHEPHYYRVQGPTFLIEFDNVQSSANHIHSVWRDFNGDFGDDVLKNHYKSAHNQ